MSATTLTPSLMPSLAPSLAPTLTPTPIPMPMPTPGGFFNDEVLGLIGICMVGPFSVLLTYLLAKYVDRYCSTTIDATIIRRIEAMRNNGRSGRVKVVLDGMEPEERLRVLERVLDWKPYSKELGAQLKMERKKEEEDKRLIKELASATRANDRANENTNNDSDSEDDVETGKLQGQLSGKNDRRRDDEDAEIVTSTSNNNNQDQEEGRQDDDEDDEEMNILDRVWKEFGMKKNQKNKWMGLSGLAAANNETAPLGTTANNNTTATEDDVAETCAICMEDYEEDQDVIIGHNCVHMYHKECLLKWMSSKHDSCPYCRTYVFDVPTFRKTAEEILGTERYRELAEQDNPEGGASSTSGSSTGGDQDEQISPQQHEA